MAHINIEIKAQTHRQAAIRQFLLEAGAVYTGLDQQTDTYFNTLHGRLKLREGTIENNLIFYDRNNQAGPKQSHFELVPIPDAPKLKSVLTTAYGIKVIVAKKREIYYIENVKFHLDQVDGLGEFVEIEAGNILAPLTVAELQLQCETYMNAFGIQKEDLIAVSYSDMLLEKLG